MDLQKTGALIMEARKEKGLTQRELADLIGVTDKAVSRWETGKGFPDVSCLGALSETLGIPAAELVGGEDGPASADGAPGMAGRVVRRMGRLLLLAAAACALVTLSMSFRVIDGSVIIAFDQIVNFLDMALLVHLLLFVLLGLASTRTLRPFGTSLSCLFYGRPLPAARREDCLLSFRAAIVSVWLGSVVWALAQTINVLHHMALTTPESVLSALGRLMAVSVLALFYALLATIVLLPLYVAAKRLPIREPER